MAGTRTRNFVVAVVAVTLTACTGSKHTPSPSSSGVPTSPPASVVTSASPSVSLGVDAAGRANPRPDRPRVALAFDATTWRTGKVTGTEAVDFTPDLSTCEVDFRLWPNKPKTAIAGDHLVINAATIAGAPVTPTLSADGGTATSPTLAVLPLATCAKPGTTVHVDLAFSLTLGVDVTERTGREASGKFAWFDYSFPLLAWEFGHGWMRDPAVNLYGDMSGSEDFELASLAVTAPAADVVTGTGAVGATTAGANGTTVHQFSAPAVRDVSVAVGDFTIMNQRDGDVSVHLATPPSTVVTPQVWAAAIARSLSALEKMLGPFPYPDVWVTVLEPALGSGFEFPGGFLIADIDPDNDAPTVVTHELAHSYFFGLVGNDQGRDPWLDESWAVWAGIAVNGADEPDLTPSAAPPAGPIGEPMTFWATQPSAAQTYFEDVYGNGGLALDDAYNAVGPEAFDAAARAYIDAEAHKIATPADVERAFVGLPKAEAILRTAGAFAFASPSASASS